MELSNDELLDEVRKLNDDALYDIVSGTRDLYEFAALILTSDAMQKFAGGINPFDLTGGTGTSTGNSLSSVGVFNYNGSYTIAPGQTVRFTSSSSGVSNSQLKYMTFSTVPEPSTYALGAIATGVMAAVARRRKAAKV